MTASTLTLTEFLLARIAEDEERFTKWALGGEISQTFRDRLLAECEAKRRIVELQQDHDNHLADWLVLAHLATVYADREGYREEWRP